MANNSSIERPCNLNKINMGREVCRRLREADNRLFGVRMKTPELDWGKFVAD